MSEKKSVLSRRNQPIQESIEGVIAEERYTSMNTISREYGTVIEYDTMIINRPIKDAVSIIPKGCTTTKQKTPEKIPIDEELRREEFNKAYGLDILLPEKTYDVDKLEEHNVYDLRENGHGDLPLPSDIKRKIRAGETPTHNTTLMEIFY